MTGEFASLQRHHSLEYEAGQRALHSFALESKQKLIIQAHGKWERRFGWLRVLRSPRGSLPRLSGVIEREAVVSHYEEA